MSQPALRLAQAATPQPPQTRGRASVALNVVEGDTMLEEYNETLAKITDCVAELHILSQQAADMKLHLVIAGKLCV